MNSAASGADIIGDSVPASAAQVGDIIDVQGVPMDVIGRLEGQGITVVDQRDRSRHSIPWNARCRLLGERWLD